MNPSNNSPLIPVIRANNREMPVTIPLVMGILNITPDSFFEGSRFTTEVEIINAAEKMIEQGAQILDIGGQSTRPGAIALNAQEEWLRVENAIKHIRKKFPNIWVSIDTFHADVAQKSIDHGVDIINDISFGLDDENMFNVLRNQDVTYIGMHKRGSSSEMQNLTKYENVVHEVCRFLKERKSMAHSEGLKNVWVDPGFGFAKNMKQNYLLMKGLHQLSEIIPEVLIGISRKSMIYKLLNCEPTEALNGSTFLHAIALSKGAKILRVHDVKAAIECVKLHQQLIESHE